MFGSGGKTLFDNLDFMGISCHICLSVEFGVTSFFDIFRKESVMAIIEKLIFFGIACLAETVICGMVHLGGQPYNGAYPK